MNYFLLKSDYYKIIQSDNLNVVISSDDSLLRQTELAAQSECISYLANRYNTDLIFAPLQDWDSATTYKWGDRIYLTATAFSATTSYVIGDRVLYDGSVLEANTSHLGAFDANDFDLIGAEGHYWMTAGYWDDEEAYTTGDTVLYETESVKKYYKALTNTTGDNPYTTSGIWQEVVNQSGELLSNTEYWVNEDSRSPHIVMRMIDLVLYHVHSRIQPRNIPDIRINRRDEAIDWLKMITKGMITVDLPLIVPVQGNNISYGGKPIRNSFY